MRARAGSLVIAATAGVLAGCANGGSEPTGPRIVADSLVAIVPTTSAPNPASYTVQEGDTLTGIADRFHVDVNELAAINGITDLDNIDAGQTLNLPDSSSSAGTTVATP